MKRYIQSTLIITLCLQPVLSAAMSDDQKRDFLLLASGVPLLVISYLGCKYIDDNRVFHRVAASRRESVQRSIDLKYQSQLEQLEHNKGRQSEEYSTLERQKIIERVRHGEATYYKTKAWMSGLVGGAAALPMLVPLCAHRTYSWWYQ